ncbi:hypothetical protein PUW79_10765 [Microbacterium sp. NE2HP2]|uniref:hypothetical protein n=1 Tax=Microbacterium plantarum TaxID=1816425 RepID=UPI002366257A|nr:hypothetical protein [Microbacterium plantarum]MDD7945111.1 hypothetical protein [Microbacterium plantarum]
MGSPEIQAFLERQVRSCASGFTCLKDYRQNTDNRPSDRYCNGYEGRGNESASTIIDRVARSCGISQKVILVLLEKEQSLVTWNAPTARAYAAATGQGCPDTAPCDSATLGFFYQVYYAARQYKIYKAFPQDFGYQAGRWNNILYHPYNNCGTQRVYIENQATAGLYIYTPYVPNQAALNNMYGKGDTCSSYGNRNFWRLYTDWFGDEGRSPVGNVELVEARPGEFRVAGWAADPDTTAPISVHVYVGNVGTAIGADQPRPDVQAAVPGTGPRHGFDALIPANGPGDPTICVYAINYGAGETKQLGCATRTAMSGSPVANLEAVSGGTGQVTVSGWAFDPDTTSPIAIHVYVGGRGTAITADKRRDDVARVYPAYGAAHGFSQSVPSPAGPQEVCVYAINVKAGSNQEVGCRTVFVAATSDRGTPPIGNFDAAVVQGDKVLASGWAIDPDTASPIDVHVYIRDRGVAVRGDGQRPDVGRVYPAYGSAHGFSTLLDLPAGQSDVCAYAINDGAGGNVLLGCKTVSRPGGADLGRPPIGSFEGVIVDGRSARAVGWALDPDTPASIPVHLYVGSAGRAYVASVARPDVSAAFPGYGAAHGFDEKIDLSPGRNDVCAYAINTGPGGNTLLGCRSVDVR